MGISPQGRHLVLCLNSSDTYPPAKNPKLEIRNPKQARITKIQMTKTTAFGVVAHCFEHSVIAVLDLFRISCFGFRILACE
jgi:hypothetical protein